MITIHRLYDSWEDDSMSLVKSWLFFILQNTNTSSSWNTNVDDLTVRRKILLWSIAQKLKAVIVRHLMMWGQRALLTISSKIKRSIAVMSCPDSETCICVNFTSDVEDPSFVNLDKREIRSDDRSRFLQCRCFPSLSHSPECSRANLSLVVSANPIWKQTEHSSGEIYISRSRTFNLY